MASCVITELDPDQFRFDSDLEKIYHEHERRPKELLATVFDFLDRKSPFFKDPNVSKTLARLLRDVKNKGLQATVQPASQPANTQGNVAKAQPFAQGSSGPVTPPQAASEPSSSSLVQPSDNAAEDENQEEKGLKPNGGNGADMDNYSWIQTLKDVVVNVPVPPGTKGRDCKVVIEKQKLHVGVKGQPPILDGEMYAAVKPDDSFWNSDGTALEITLQKVDGMSWWKSVLKGEPEINTQKVEPENSKLSDLDAETRQTVEKMMWDQRQKQMGLPTSKEAQQQEMLNKFMKQHPEMDFSKAKFMSPVARGNGPPASARSKVKPFPFRQQRRAKKRRGIMRSAAFFEDDARRKGSGGSRRASTRPVLPDFDEPADGSGSRRRAPVAEAESPSGRPSNWFLHDDRDLQAEGPGARGGSGDQYGGRRDSRRGGRVQPGGPGASRYSRPGEWEYVDPKGVIQGPFSSKEVLKWADAGFFTPDQQVRQAGEVKFVSLRACMHQLQQDMKGPPAEGPTQRGGRGGSIAQADQSYRKPRPSRSLEQAPDGSYKGHPADALLSPNQVEDRQEELQAGPGRGGYSRRGGHEGPGGRGPGRDSEQGYGRRGGRGGSYGDAAVRPERQDRRGSAAAAAQPSPEPEGPKLPHSLKVAQRLFTGDATLATEEPVWRYVDPSGQTQGPFPARNMLEWYRRGLLNDMSLQTCGAERKVAPPDFPQPEHYRPLGTLLQGIKRGQRFHPLTVLDIRAGQGNAYHPFVKGPREAKAATISAQDSQPQAPTGADSLPKRQTPSARGRGKAQGPPRGAAPAEAEQRVSLQLAHGVTEEDGIKIALSLGNPSSLPVPADLQLVDMPEDMAEMPRKGDTAAPPEGPAGSDASLGPLAAGAHGAGASKNADALPVLAPASLLGPAFVGTPEKPAAPDFRDETSQGHTLPGATGHASSGTAEAADQAQSEHPAAAEDDVVPVQPGTASGPLAEAAAGHSEISTAEEPAGVTDAAVEPKEPAAPKASQPAKEAEFVPAEGSLSSIHVQSAPSKALDAAERGESPAAHADGGAAQPTFAKAAAPDAEAAEKVHNILVDNVKAVEAANDSTADTLDAALHKHGGAPADALDGEEDGKDHADPAAPSHMIQAAGAAASDAEVTEPATESPELLGVAGAGEQKRQPQESAGAEGAAANYHTQGTGQPAEDSAAEPAMAAPELLGIAAAGEKGSRHADAGAWEVPSTHSAQQRASAKDGSEQVLEPVADIGKDEPGIDKPAASMTEADTISEVTQASAETPGDAKAAEPAEGSTEFIEAAKTTDAASEPSAGLHHAEGTDAAAPPKSSGSAASEAKSVVRITQAAAETPGDAKAAEPAVGSIEFLGAAKATDAASEPASSSAGAAAAPQGGETTAAPAQDTSTEAALHPDRDAGPAVTPAEAAADRSESAADAKDAPRQEEGSEQGKKEHGSLFKTARAFFKRKEADGKH